jgi:hypothetical protein
MSFWGCYERLVQTLSQTLSKKSRYVSDATNGGGWLPRGYFLNL